MGYATAACSSSTFPVLTSRRKEHVSLSSEQWWDVDRVVPQIHHDALGDVVYPGSGRGNPATEYRNGRWLFVGDTWGHGFTSSVLGPIELVGQIHEELAQQMIELMLVYVGFHVLQ